MAIGVVMPLVFTAISSGSANSNISTKPNLIIIFTDDQGYGDVGCFGGKHVKTPHLDQMASEGMKFTRFYAAPVCTASRAAIMTGSYPSRVSLSFGSTYPVLLSNEVKGLNPTETTIAEVLKSAGYTTACIGKWHLGNHETFLPYNQGFDYFFGLPYSHDMYPEYDLLQKLQRGRAIPPLRLYRNKEVIETAPDPSQLTRRYTEESIEFIKKNKDKPFFLYLSHNMPHRPAHASRAFTREYSDEKIKAVNEALKRGKVNDSDFLYTNSIAEIDWSTGEIIKSLKQLGLDNKTLIVFTSDNGPAGGLGVATPLRGRKNSSYEGGLRVPCIVRWPEQVPAGTEFNQIATTMDLLPTFAHLAGAPLPIQPIDGKDLAAVLKGMSKASPHQTFFYYRNQKCEGVAVGNWKLLNGELYNLENDVGERKNIAANHPDTVKELQARIDLMRRKLGHGRLKGSEQREAGWVNDQPGASDSPRPEEIVNE